MRRRAAAWLALAIGAATLFWLGYSTGRVQSLADLAFRARDADTDRYSLTRGGVLVQFERLGGAGKPYIRSADGQELFDMSDWDRDSRIIVDGRLFELVRLYPQSSVDYGRSRLAETLNGDGWLLQREISLEADGNITIEHMFVSRRSIRRVDLSVAHVHSVFLDLHLDETSAVGSVNRLDVGQIAAGVVAPPAFRISVRSAANEGEGNARFRVAASTQAGPSSFVSEMSADEPARDTRVVLGHETIRVERLPG
jgi:hypothetical protein